MGKKKTEHEKAYRKKKGLKVVAGKKPWNQLEGEPDKHYHAFANYRDQAAPRVVSETVMPNGKVIAKPTLYLWSKQFNWVERAKQFDEWRENQLTTKKAILMEKQSAKQKVTQYENIAAKLRFFTDLAGDVLVDRLINDPDWVDKLSIKDLIIVQEKLIALEKQLYGDDYFDKNDSLADINFKNLSVEERIQLKELIGKAKGQEE